MAKWKSDEHYISPKRLKDNEIKKHNNGDDTIKNHKNGDHIIKAHRRGEGK